MWFQRFRSSSLAQLLVVVSLVSVLCSCAVTLRQIFAYAFPFNIRDVQISPDGATVGLALTGGGRSCVLLCDGQNGQCLWHVELGGGAAPTSSKLSRDCSTGPPSLRRWADRTWPVGVRRARGARPSPEFQRLLSKGASDRVGRVELSGDGAFVPRSSARRLPFSRSPPGGSFGC